LEGRRDGTPLIFGWGGHLTRAQKNAYQHRAAYAFIGLVGALILVVLAYGLIRQNLIIPNEAVVSVNGANINQETYRKHLAFDAQQLWNSIQSNYKQKLTLEASQNPDPTKDAALTEQIQGDEGNYSQSTITSNSVQELIEDQLILNGAKTFEQQNHVAASTFTPTSSDIDKALRAFKAAFPAGEAYQDFLSKNNMSDSDVRSFIAMQLRRTKMQAYLSSLLVSPTRQAHLRRIQVGSQSKATQVYKLIENHGDWNALAKQYSTDVDTKDNGGDMGFVPPGSGDAGIDVWAYAPATKAGDVTVLRDASGSHDVVQVLEYQQDRGYDSNMLSDAQSNALNHWLNGQKVASFNKITTPSSTMLTDTRNLPVEPDLNAQLPNVSSQSGAPGVP
jgi:hypothetical protein